MQKHRFIQWLRERIEPSSESGVVFVEATIALTAFMFFVVTLLTIVNICYTQAKIGTALNETAKEISEYSYLYAVTGLNDKEKEMYGKVADTKDQIKNVSEGVGTFYDSLKSSGNIVHESAENPNLDSLSNTLEGLQTNGENMKTAQNQIYQELEKIADNPKDFVLGVGRLLGYEGIQLAKSKLIAAPLTKCLIKKHLKNRDDGDCEQYLASLRIVPGASGYLNGINFGDSTLFTNGDNSIKLVAKYKVKVIALLPIDIQLNFCQSAETEGWFGK